MKITLIGQMAENKLLLWMCSDSGINTIEDFVAAGEKACSGWIVVGTGKGQEELLLTNLPNST
jgi:tripartite-type tricarboxylate transporter receptor subunit TctC